MGRVHNQLTAVHPKLSARHNINKVALTRAACEFGSDRIEIESVKNDNGGRVSVCFDGPASGAGTDLGKGEKLLCSVI